MRRENGKIYFDACEMISEMDTIVSASKLPRTAVIPIIRDPETGYINAAPYSGGVVSLNPYMILFGVKSWDVKGVFERVSDFVVSLCRADQLNDMYIMGNSIPHGISEIEVAGLTEYELPGTDVPGIREFPVNMRCRLRKLIRLGGALRNIVVAEVTGVSIDEDLIHRTRAEAVNMVPLNETVLIHPYTKGYAPAVIGKNLRGAEQKPCGHVFEADSYGKVFLDQSLFYKKPYNDAFVKVIFPRPNYILISENGHGPEVEIINGGIVMHAPPAVQIPLRTDSRAYKNIVETGCFTLAYPTWDQEEQYLALRKTPDHAEAAGFHFEYSGNIPVPGLLECPVNVECRVFRIETIPGSQCAVVVADKVGMYVDESMESESQTGFINYFPRLMYSVMDYGMYERFGSICDVYPCLPLPTYGSRQNGVWFTGPEQYQSGFQFWLLDLWLTGYITEAEYHLIRKWILHFRYEGRCSPEPLRGQMRKRITKALNLMTHAHRDFDRWQQVHRFFEPFLKNGQYTYMP